MGFLVKVCRQVLRSATAVLQESLNHGTACRWCCLNVFGMVSAAIPSSVLLKFSMGLVALVMSAVAKFLLA